MGRIWLPESVKIDPAPTARSDRARRVAPFTSLIRLGRRCLWSPCHSLQQVHHSARLQVAAGERPRGGGAEEERVEQRPEQVQRWWGRGRRKDEWEGEIAGVPAVDRQ